jgi:hypothetical protein
MIIPRGSLLIGFCLTWAAIACPQTATSPFAVVISAEVPATKIGPDTYTVKAGSDVFINVRLTNTSKQNLSIGVEADSRTNVDFFDLYEVRDSFGNSAPKRVIKHPEIGSTGHGWPAHLLKPGESLNIDDRISGLYDLTRLGKYTIQAVRVESSDPKTSKVRSNTITLAVTE